LAANLKDARRLEGGRGVRSKDSSYSAAGDAGCEANVNVVNANKRKRSESRGRSLLQRKVIMNAVKTTDYRCSTNIGFEP
jgi:hypothetical protein